MSKKLLFNEGGKSESVPVLNKYTGTKSGYPIEETSELLDEEEKTYIEEIHGNTWQDNVDGKNLLDESIYTFSKNSENKYKVFDHFIKYDSSKDYFISTFPKLANDLEYIYIRYYDNDKNEISRDINYNYADKLLPKSRVPENTYYIKLQIRIHDKDQVVDDDYIHQFKLQIEEGTASTEYEPYHKADLTDIRSVGDTVIDEIYEIEVIQATCPYEFGKGGRL